MLLDIGIIAAVGLLIGELGVMTKDKIVKYIKRPNKDRILSQYELLVGHGKDGDIIIDMKIVPHLLIAGLSGNGKTKCAELMLKDKLNVLLINCYQEDFRAVKNAKRINNMEEIEQVLKSILEANKPYNIPMYICIDEILMLCRNKKINDLIMQLLAVGRHLNVFVISIVQIATKNNLPFKDLHNSRITFKQLEPSAYRVVIPAIPDDINTDLKQREFICYYNGGIVNGVTYDV